MAIDVNDFDNVMPIVDEWEDQKEKLPKDTWHDGVIFDFGCFEAKTGKDYATFGVMVDHDGEQVKCQRFYEVTSRTYWKLKQDITSALGFCPEAGEIQVMKDGVGRTGNVITKILGKKVRVFWGTVNDWEDLHMYPASHPIPGGSTNEDLDLADGF